MKNLELGNFISEGKVFLVQCPKCKIENYSLAVAQGICYLCGLDGNKYYKNNVQQKNMA